MKNVHVAQYLNLEPHMTDCINKKSNYRLTSMVTHLGASRQCGHYTAIGHTASEKYYEFDDSHVRAISMDAVKNTNGNTF